MLYISTRGWISPTLAVVMRLAFGTAYWSSRGSKTKISSAALMQLELPTSDAGCLLVLDALNRTDAEISRLKSSLKDGEEEIDGMVAKLYGLSRQHRRVIKEFLDRF